ncbi:site-2 protease family protein [Candidatus Kaiserbacteria bacterium]|nr:site-2 protease family protein [Candidatus Kaiserbacteria bacterium]
MTPEITLSLIILILSVIAHEVAHGYAANALGDPTARLAGRLTLNPLPHIDFLGSVILPALLVFSGSPILFGWAKPVPYNPYNLRNQRWGEAFVAVAGSATNLLLAVIFGLLVRYGSAGGMFFVPGSPALSLAATIAFVNLFLGLFNLIPFPPLDGFTVLRCALPWSLSRGLLSFESSVRGLGAISLILFILIFASVLARPFYGLVLLLFGLLTGAA